MKPSIATMPVRVGSSEVVIHRDNYGRPKIPDPVTGKMRTWTRATTLASTIADRYGLEKWAQRELVRGFAIRGEKLLLQAAAAGEDKSALTRVVDAALEAAQSSSSAEIGTALHRIAERIDAGEEVDIPPAYKPDIDAYRKALVDNDVKVVDGWLERFVVVPEVEAAGTLDRLMYVQGYFLPMIGDLKTGSDPLKYGAVEIAAQLAIYSRATHYWDGEKHHPMPKVDQDFGLVAHMPAGKGRCDLYLIDLKQGWEIVKLCASARAARKTKDLYRPLTPSLVAAEPEEENNDNSPVDMTDEALKARIKDIVKGLEGAPLPVPWPQGVTPPKQIKDGAWTPPERVRILKWCELVAPRTTAAPF
jgi:hypothetical protein